MSQTPVISTPSAVDSARDADPAWAIRLRVVCMGLRSPQPAARRDRLEEEAWLLLRALLLRFARMHTSGEGMAREDFEDLASDRAFGLLRRAVSGQWDPSRRSSGEMAAFLSRVARNAIVDRARRDRRARRALDHVRAMEAQQAGESTRADDPADVFERREAADALIACVEALAPRARRAWYLRVMLELPSRAIADHPDIRLAASHVDVVLQRARRDVRSCFARKGYRTSALPRQAFVALWDRLWSHVHHAEGA